MNYNPKKLVAVSRYQNYCICGHAVQADGKDAMVKLVIYWMSRTRLGALCTTEHCRHAPGEMEELDEAFQTIRAKKADFLMPEFDRMRASMPSWEQIREVYMR